MKPLLKFCDAWLFAFFIFGLSIFCNEARVTPNAGEDPGSYLTSHQDEMTDLFREFTPRDTPLYLCEGGSEGVKYRIPKVKECKMPRAADAKNNSKEINVTIFLEDISIKTLKGEECFGEKERIRREVGILNAKYEYRDAKEKIYISATQCRDMASSHRAPNGEKLTRLTSGLFGTSDARLPEFSWWRSIGGPTEVIRENYYIVQVSIAINSKDNSINPATNIIDNCQASAKECETTQGILIWNSYEINSCRMKEFISTECLMTPTENEGIRVSCQEINMAYSNIVIHKTCGANVGRSIEGQYLTSTFADEMVVGVASTSEVREIFFPSVSRKVKRQVGISTDQGINARFSYYHEIIREGHNFDILNAHYRICLNSRAIQNNAIFQARAGNPTALVMTYTGDPSYRATLNGDVISLRKCKVVDRYYFVPRDFSVCTLEFPVIYVLKAGDSPVQAWVTPIGHELVTEPSYVDCPSPQFYFEMLTRTVLLDKQAVVTSLDELVYAGDSIEPRLISAIAFETNDRTIMYKHSEMGTETLMDMQRAMSNRYVADKAIVNYQKGIELTEKQEQATWGIKKISLDGFWETYFWVVTFFGILFSLVAAAVLHLYYEKLWTFAKWVWNCICKISATIREFGSKVTAKPKVDNKVDDQKESIPLAVLPHIPPKKSRNFDGNPSAPVSYATVAKSNTLPNKRNFYPQSSLEQMPM